MSGNAHIRSRIRARARHEVDRLREQRDRIFKSHEPQVQACVSPLHANGADYVPASASTPTAFLASTGGTAVLGLGMAILAAALILWETAKGVRSTE